MLVEEEEEEVVVLVEQQLEPVERLVEESAEESAERLVERSVRRLEVEERRLSLLVSFDSKRNENNRLETEN